MSKIITNIFIFLTLLTSLFVILPKTNIFQQHIFQRSLVEPIPISVEILAYKNIHHAFAMQFSADTQDMEYIINSKETLSMDNLQTALDTDLSKLKHHIILLDKLNFSLDDKVTLHSNLSFIDKKVESQFQFASPALELLFVRENIAVYIRIKM